MGQRVIADNWSLQDVSELLTQGIDPEDNPGISALTDPGTLGAPLPRAVISFEALFDLLTDIVLRDQILVDDQYHDAWFGLDEPLADLARRSIVRPHPFLDYPERLDAPRKLFLAKLLLNPLMSKEQEQNEAAWMTTHTTPHRFTSQLVWGGAGMLARAWLNQAPYTPHPLRRRLFERAGIVLHGQPQAALSELNHAVAEHRTEIYRGHAGEHSMYGLQVMLPALPALVLREASSLSDLFDVASQMRDELSEVRTWLSRFQEALSLGDFKAVAPERKRLRSLAKQVDRALGKKAPNGATMAIGWSWLKFSTKLDPEEWMTKLNPVQTQLNRLTFAPSGHAELRKLLGFFGHERSEVAMKTLEYFSRPAA